MIVKHISRTGKGSSCRNLIKYVLRYVNGKTELQQSGKKPFVYTHNLQSRDTEGYIKEFRETANNRKDRRVNQCSIRHTVLSWKVEDAPKISHQVLKAIAKQYIKLRGDNTQYLFVQHLDRSHAHIHVCESNGTISGKSNRMSKADFANLKISMDSFQKIHFPELVSLPDHGRSQRIKVKRIKQWQNKRLTQKEGILKALDTAYAHAISIEDFTDRLKAKGLEPYYRGKEKKLSGITDNGSRRFRLGTLGFDEKKLSNLNLMKAREQKELEELKRIRTRAKEREIEHGFERELIKQHGSYQNLKGARG